MVLFDWPAITATVITFLSGIFWVGRQQQRLNQHEVQLVTVDKTIKALDAKMDQHTLVSAEQWGQVQRALGRIEGKIGTKREQ